MLKKLFVAICLTFLSTLSFAYEVKGITLGKPFNGIGKGEFKDFICEPFNVADISKCTGIISYATADKVMTTVLLDSKSVVIFVALSLTASDISYHEMISLLTDKYGNKTLENQSQIENNVTELVSIWHEEKTLDRIWLRNSLITDISLPISLDLMFYTNKGSEILKADRIKNM